MDITTTAIRGWSSVTKVIDAGVDAAASRKPWAIATAVDIRQETARAKTIRFALGQPSHHLAGQHYVVRLTAPDGYRAMRSYSIASAPDDSNEFELTVEWLPDGEVSSFLHDELVVGDELEVRGPIGGWFIWDGSAPALLVGGGSGLVPLMSMLRLARQLGRGHLLRTVVSVRSRSDLFYADEIDQLSVTVVYSRQTPPGSERRAGRLGLDDIVPLVQPGAVAYICGSVGFTNAASDLVVQAEVPVELIRVERFGPTG